MTLLYIKSSPDNIILNIRLTNQQAWAVGMLESSRKRFHKATDKNKSTQCTCDISNRLDRLGLSRIASIVFLTSSFIVLNKSYNKCLIRFYQWNMEHGILGYEQKKLPQTKGTTFGQKALIACSQRNPKK